jgi:VCBS repeat-containing protein
LLQDLARIESDAVLTATGTLTISDVDSPASFVAQTNTAGHNGYGKFSLTTAGVWTYVMDTAHNEFVNGVVYTDSFTVSSVDGTLKLVTVTIHGANDAPVLEPHVFALSAIAQDAGLPSGVVGSLVTDFFGIATDLDAVTANGVAITGINANGVLYYSVNGGVDWLAATGVSRENALLLSSNSTNRVYFQPNAGYYGEIADAVVFCAWDASAGVDGIYANAAIAGGESAYSIDFSALSQHVVRGVSIDDVSIDNSETWESGCAFCDGSGWHHGCGDALCRKIDGPEDCPAGIPCGSCNPGGEPR